jgi:hypothetical protein
MEERNALHYSATEIIFHKSFDVNLCLADLCPQVRFLGDGSTSKRKPGTVAHSGCDVVDGTMTEFSVIAPDSAGRFPDKVRVLARQFCRERNIHPHQECGRVLAERWHLKHDVVVGRNKEALPENLTPAISSFANFLNNSSVFENRYQDRSFVNRYRTMFFDTSTCREEAKYVSQELKDSDGITLSSFDDIFFKRFGIRETSMYYYLMRELFLRMPPSVTVVITSCNRHNLLFNTISSFIKFNTWKHIQKMIIVEDCKISNEQAVSMESNVV